VRQAPRSRIPAIALWNSFSLSVMPSGSQACTALTDEELARRYQATGDSEYFAQIFARHRRLVFCACRRFFGGNTLAEDATQETFLRAYQAINRFEQGNLCGWLMRIARNVCIDLWRKQRPESQAAEIGKVDPPETANLHRMTEVSLAMEKVYEEMKSLSTEQRHCLEMKMDGYSYEETAERTGLSVVAVKSHLQNGRRMLWLRVEGILSQLL
jgi:RNA polymerase sigma factor (sigma-70 family)